MTNYRKLTAGLIAAWFLFALSASAFHLFTNAASRFGPAVAIAALTPLVLFLIWFASSRSFREFTLALNPRALTLIQSWRLMGFTFVLLQAHSLLPGLFAFPAGFGDMAVGATATYTAWKLANPEHRAQFIRWQWMGIADLVLAVTLGTTAPLLNPHGVSTGLMTVLPLSLIPTFLVPLFMMLHIICIAQARSWKHIAPRSSQPFPTAQPSTI
jgi:hypothetical protein